MGWSSWLRTYWKICHFVLLSNLIIQLERAVEDGFIAAAQRVEDIVIVEKDPVQLVDKIVKKMSCQNKN